MRFALVDLEGSTVDSFDTVATARDAIKFMLVSDSASASELTILEYRDGERYGSPRSLWEFLNADRRSAQRVAGEGRLTVEVSTPEGVVGRREEGVAAVQAIELSGRIRSIEVVVRGLRRAGRRRGLVTARC